MTVKSYEELEVWKKSVDLVTSVYRVVKRLPREEMFALSDQIRRSAVSVPSNIAEGEQRLSLKEYINFLSIAKGSLGELKTQLIISEKLGYLKEDEVSPLFISCDDIGRMLSGLIKSLSNKMNNQPRSSAAGTKSSQFPASGGTGNQNSQPQAPSPKNLTSPGTRNLKQ